jgi:hypothetical protein
MPGSGAHPGVDVAAAPDPGHRIAHDLVDRRPAELLHERPRAADQRVAEERAGRRDQPGRGRQAGDLGVGDRLRRHDAPDHEPGDQVGRAHSRR